MKIDFEKVLADYGLKVGDKVKVKLSYCRNEILEIRKIGKDIVFRDYKDKCDLSVRDILDLDFEKVEPKKKVGDMICDDIRCNECPLHCMHCVVADPNTLYVIFKKILNIYPELESMRDYIEKELDKEVDNE